MFLINYLLGYIEDNTGLFVHPYLFSGLQGCTDFIGYPAEFCQNYLISNQPLISIPTFLLAKNTAPILAYNLIILAGTALNFFFAYKFFKKLFGRYIAALLATVFLASPFLAYQSRSHFDLMQFWPVIWFLNTLFFSKSNRKAVYLGLLLTLITGISNYLGYFTIMAVVLYGGLAKLPPILKERNRAVILAKLRFIFTMGGIFILTTFIFLAPYIKSNYFSPKVRAEKVVDTKSVNRPFEDFMTFSSRPWYYLLPSVDNPFFGKLSQQALDRLASEGNYLTQNYFKAEHSSSYLGWMNLVLASIGVLSLAIARRKRRLSTELSGNNGSGLIGWSLINYPAVLITIIGLIILTMPPSFTVNSSTIYTPSYLLFKFFPMFRVLARAGIVILFLTLIFTGYGYLAIVKFSVAKNLNRRVIRSTLLILALLSVAEFVIPLKITHVGTPPQVYSYIGATDHLKSPIVVYPYAKTNEALFWITAHNQPLINPRMYENRATGFISEDFTNLLNTAVGLDKANQLGAKYLVYFNATDKNITTAFFDQSLQLQRMEEFIEISPARASDLRSGTHH